MVFTKPAGFAMASPQNNGDDDGADSDADPNNGTTACVTLTPGESNLTVDAGFYNPPLLGDRVWQDLNGDGSQDCTLVAGANEQSIIPGNGGTCSSTEPGIPGVKVNLYDCSGNPLNRQTTTDTNGFYLFSGLTPGACYQVQFEEPTAYCAGAAFTSNASGVDPLIDSDADPTSGFSGSVTLGTTDNRSIDAGVTCPVPTVSLGDRVWEDKDRDGSQDCTLAAGADGQSIIPGNGGTCTEPGIPGVKVNLYDCAGNNLNRQETTDADGFYLFSGLTSDACYQVQFEKPTTYCAGAAFTSNASGVDPLIDSDADPTSGFSGSVTLGTTDNRSIDAGVTCPVVCDLTLEKTCQIIPPPPAAGNSCDIAGKPTALTFEFTGDACDASTNPQGGKFTCNGTATQSATVSAPGLTVTGSPVDLNKQVTLSGSFGAQTSFTVGSQALSIHTSCSQVLSVGDQFGSLRLVKFVGQNGTVEEPTPPAPATSCVYRLPEVPGCKIEPAVSSLTSVTFKYTGGDCNPALDNLQSGKFTCSGLPGSAPASVSKTSGKGTISPASANVGDLLEFTGPFDAQSSLQVGGQSLSIHTSCSQRLAVGDRFGSLTVVGINGQRNTVKVQYGYDVSGSTSTGQAILVDKVGSSTVFGPQTVDVPGQYGFTEVLEGPQVRTNTATATDTIDTACKETDSATVTIKPPLPPFNCSDAKPITELDLYYVGPSGVDIQVVGQTSPAATNVQYGQAVKLTGLSGNDVYVDIRKSIGFLPLGQSTFHLSCSDEDMNGTEDCGKLEGDGKAQAGKLNVFVFNGMKGKQALVCDLPPPAGPAPDFEACNVEQKGAITISGRKLLWNLQNTTIFNRTVKSVSVDWPISKEKLARVKLGGRTIYDTDDKTVNTSIGVGLEYPFKGNVTDRTLEASGAETLEIEFGKDVNTGDNISVTVVFEEPTSCAVNGTSP